ncbi:hypothetical protein GGX14DRAFT_523281 [Mycena pura]|uniref:Uncharacterized protein n=1 Tax=Mycena pura TaxID=153505 RepID=A0AAD6VDL2_9AGAR|nr:hypothetical protein GGX14DRAFT_523281 [Mycena pura]
MEVSPRKKPTFSPRKATRPSAPEDDDDFGAVNAPLGVSLLLRSVYTAGVAITTTSAVTLAQATIDRLLAAHADLPSVVLRPFSTFKPSTSCYLRVAPDPDDIDTTPRFDLLEPWLTVLRKDKPGWEIVWQPMSEGKDKRMTIRLGDAGFRKEKGDKSSCPALEKVKTALVARGILITDSYSLSNGSYIGLADHHHVDDILAAGAISAPAVSPNPIPVTRCRQIEIKNCFELVVSGLSEGEGVQSSLCRWLTRNFRDAVTNESFFVDARVDEYERDCLVFFMSDWASTARVLAAGERLVSQFKGNSPSIHRPQLLLAFNNNGVWRPKSLAQTFEDGASSVNNALASLRAEVHELKRETRAQFESNQLAISAVSKTVTTLHSTVDSLHNRLSNHASAFLHQSAEQATRAQLVQTQMIMAQHQNTMRFGHPDHYADAKAEYDRLYEEQKALMNSLTKSAGRAIAMLGGSLGSSIAPPVAPPGLETHASSSAPPVVPPGPATRSRVPPTSSSAPPVVPSGPATRSRVSPTSGETANKRRKSSNVETQDDDSLMTDTSAAP